MSNPTHAPAFPLTRTQALLDAGNNVGYYEVTEEKRARLKGLKSPEAVLDMLHGKALHIVDSIVLDKTLIRGKELLDRVGNPKPILLAAANGPPVMRVRSAVAVGVLNECMAALPVGLRKAYQERTVQSFSVGGGCPLHLGRLQRALKPMVGGDATNPPTLAEADSAANAAWGLDKLDWGVMRAYPLIQRDSEKAVRMAAHSRAGVPTMGNYSDPEVRATQLGLALGLRKELVERERKDAGGGRAYLRELEASAPHMLAAVSATKTEVVTGAKLDALSCRRYAIYPKYLQMNCAVATQPFSAGCRNILSHWQCHSMLGASLTHGGADALADAFTTQLDEHDCAYAHGGDDCTMAFNYNCFEWKETVGGHVVGLPTRRTGILTICLDFSDCDITMQWLTRAPLVRVIERHLRRIDAAAASAWAYSMGDTLEVLSGSLAAKTKEMGKTGGLLNSHINDLAAGVLAARLKARLGRTSGQPRLYDGRSAESRAAGPRVEAEGLDVLDEDIVRATVKELAIGMGLNCRVDYIHFSPCPPAMPDTVRSRIDMHAFLVRSPHPKVMGMMWHATMQGEGQCKALVMMDWQRRLSALAYPHMHVKGNEDFKVAEAGRLIAIALSQGVPDQTHRQAGAILDARARKLVGAIVASSKEKAATPIDQFLSAYSVDLDVDLRGSLSALKRREDIWNTPRPAGTGRGDRLDPAPLPANASWADEEQAAEDEPYLREGVPEPPLADPARHALMPIAMPRLLPLAHPLTTKQAGRPPRTARWGPDLPPNIIKRVAGFAGRALPLARLSASFPGEEEEEYADQLAAFYEAARGSDDGSVYDPDFGEDVDELEYIEQRLRIQRR